MFVPSALLLALLPRPKSRTQHTLNEAIEYNLKDNALKVNKKQRAHGRVYTLTNSICGVYQIRERKNVLQNMKSMFKR